jgi:hypothetical protein
MTALLILAGLAILSLFLVAIYIWVGLSILDIPDD